MKSDISPEDTGFYMCESRMEKIARYLRYIERNAPVWKPESQGSHQTVGVPVKKDLPKAPIDVDDL